MQRLEIQGAGEAGGLADGGQKSYTKINWMKRAGPVSNTKSRITPLISTTQSDYFIWKAKIA